MQYRDDLEKLIGFGLDKWRKEAHITAREYWDEYLSLVGIQIAESNYANMKPLMHILDKFGPIDYLTLCNKLLVFKLKGHSIAWAWKYCKEDVDIFHKQMINGFDEELLVYIEEQKALFDALTTPTLKSSNNLKKVHKSRQNSYKRVLVQSMEYFIAFVVVYSISHLSARLWSQE